MKRTVFATATALSLLTGAGMARAQPTANAPTAPLELSPEEDELAHEILRGDAGNLPGAPGIAANKAAARAADLQSQLDTLATSGKTGQILVDAVQRIDAQLGIELEGVLDYRFDTSIWPPRTRTEMTALARQANPNFWEGRYQAMRKDYAPSGVGGRTFATAYAMAEEAVQVLKAVEGLPPNTAMPSNSPRLAEAARAWHNFDRHNTDITLSFTAESYPRTPRFQTPWEFRRAIKMEAGLVNTIVKTYRNYWKGYALDADPPGYSPEAEGVFKAIDRMDLDTGEISGDVPPQLRDAVPAGKRSVSE